MQRLLLALGTILLLLLARGADLTATLYFSPDLAREGNPIVMFFGFGLRGLVLANVILFVFALLGLGAYWRGSSFALKERPKTLSSFTVLWFRRVALHRRPFKEYLSGGAHQNEGMQAFRLFGLVLSWALIFGSFAAVYAWCAIWETPTRSHAYEMLYSGLSVGRFSLFPAITAALGGLFGAMVFFVSEYRRIPPQRGIEDFCRQRIHKNDIEA